MLERLELNNRDLRGRELYVRHQQVYTLLELNIRFEQLRRVGNAPQEIEEAMKDLSALISDTVSRYEEAAVSDRRAPFYSDSQISKLETASSLVKALCEEKAPIGRLMQAARNVVSAGSQPRYAPPRLVVSNG
ncbi:hypothetical protein NUH88_20640 [Nisaea acidiphila]|uniref:Uncharacterized protein n=1 Tax=Nisaea acidiphila TaxID=1862145 RepID=A0A9J7ATY8_9PROT|nr:hypothetical protein [Nisaea acidiphila]UUX49788.1 hypothetical protein NUH88_20640 [Nisaea acidiphila]